MCVEKKKQNKTKPNKIFCFRILPPSLLQTKKAASFLRVGGEEP